MRKRPVCPVLPRGVVRCAVGVGWSGCRAGRPAGGGEHVLPGVFPGPTPWQVDVDLAGRAGDAPGNGDELLSLIHISEPTRLGMISYAVFCLKKKNKLKKK